MTIFSGAVESDTVGDPRRAPVDPFGEIVERAWEPRYIESQTERPATLRLIELQGLTAVGIGRPTQPTVSATVAAKFVRLRDWWVTDTRFQAGASSRFMHPAYQQIIGMGRPVLPLLLGEIRTRADDWFWALSSITGEDPAIGHDTVDGAIDSWLRWASDRGYVY